MSFSIQLTTDMVQVDPGATVPVSVTVTSRSAEQDQFELDVEGIDSDWRALPVPVFTVEPNEAHSEKFFLKPPRTSENAAGDYPIVVKVRSLVSGESRAVQAILKVKPFHHLTLEISPRKGFVSPFRKNNRYELSLGNLGNTEHTVQFLAGDPEDACTFSFEQEQMTVGPGQTRELSFVATPTSQRLITGSRLVGFTVTARSNETPAAAASAQAQLEQRPFISVGGAILALILGVLYGLFIYTMPKPPKLDLSVDSRQVLQGKSVTIHWTAKNCDKVEVYALHDGRREHIYEGVAADMTKEFTPTDLGVYAIRAIATHDAKHDEQSVDVEVREPDKGPSPEVLEFKATPDRIKLGQTFSLSYKFNENVKRAVLGPTNQELPLSLPAIDIQPTRTGQITYTVAAYNDTGLSITKSVTVTVYDESDASIIAFDASPTEVPPDVPKTTLTWQVVGAARVELRRNGADPIKLDPEGKQDFMITQATTFTLTAIDEKNRPITRKIVVKIQKPPTGPDPNDVGPNGGPPTVNPPVGGQR